MPDEAPPMHLQAPSPSGDSGWLETLKLGGVFVLGALASFIGFRTQIYGIKRDVRDLERKDAALDEKVDRHYAELKKLIEDSVASIQKTIADQRDGGQFARMREDRETEKGLQAIRLANDKNHGENKRALKIIREQLVVFVRLVAKIARSVPGIDQAEVDAAVGDVFALEVERAD